LGAVLQGLAGFFYLVATTGAAILIGAAYADGAGTLNQIERFATQWLTSFDSTLVFYGILFLVWLFVSIPAFRLVGEAEKNEWQSRVDVKLAKYEDLLRQQAEAQASNRQILTDILNELKRQNTKV